MSYRPYKRLQDTRTTKLRPRVRAFEPLMPDVIEKGEINTAPQRSVQILLLLVLRQMQDVCIFDCIRKEGVSLL
jgi:hypothetical protein